MNTDTNHSEKRSSRALMITASIFGVLGLAWAMYWWTYARFYIYTDDAYVDGNQVVVCPRINGTLISFSAIDGALVEEGTILVQLDPEDSQIALTRTTAQLAEAIRQVAKLFEEAQRDRALVEVRKAEFIRAAQDYEHRKGLVEEGSVSLEEFEHIQAALNSAFFGLNASEYQARASLYQIQNTTIPTHPLVEEAKTAVRDAYLHLQRCSVRAPVTGIVAQRNAEVGNTVKSGQPLMAIVPLNQLWVTANFKEVQLKHMRIGQSVKVFSDTYGHDAPFMGTVVGIGGGTGSVFSLLPPQNATGNWIKIVQRVPVTISLDQDMVRRYPLRMGLSLEVTVNAHDTSGSYIPMPLSQQPLFETSIFINQEEGVEPLIARILEANLPQAPEHE